MISILACPRTGGITDLKHQRESATSSVDLQKQMEACVAMDQFLTR